MAEAGAGVATGKTKLASGRPERITPAVIAGICDRLARGQRVRRSLPGSGRIHIDRQLPFLTVYRRPVQDGDTGTDRLVIGEASYLLAPGDRKHRAGVAALVDAVAETLSEGFGAFLIIEVWAGPPAETDAVGGEQVPAFRIFSRKGRLSSTVQVLQRGLSEVPIKGVLGDAAIVTQPTVAPPGLPSLVTASRAKETNWRLLGIEVRPVYRDAQGTDYPLIRRTLHRGLSRALKLGVFEFTRRETTHRPKHYHALGRRAMVKAVWEVDRELAEISNSFDFLLQVTPVNATEAWREFRRSRFEAEPVFVSRARSIDPPLSKRHLYRIPIERIEDPTLAELFRDQQRELDRKLTMLGERDTPDFLYGSLQLFGGVDDATLNTAYEILNRVPARTRDESRGGSLDAAELAARAEQEIDHYRASDPQFMCQAKIRDDVSGLMVSRGSLLVGSETSVPESRVDALLQHEIGTHAVTYYNAKAQPFRQLYVGLPDYEELQEGLAVLAEYLVGGLSRPRLRLIAARVVAVRRMVDGASFPEVFRELDRAYEFEQRTAFMITMRVFRGGGLTKDAVYLRGLVAILNYLREGGRLDPLFIGKIGIAHIPIIEELELRGVLRPAPFRPRYLERPEAQERLVKLQNGMAVIDLVSRSAESPRRRGGVRVDGDAAPAANPPTTSGS